MTKIRLFRDAVYGSVEFITFCSSILKLLHCRHRHFRMLVNKHLNG